MVKSIYDRIMGNEKTKDEQIVGSSDELTNESNEKRIIGKIIKLDKDGGWGFISSKEIKFTRIFFHWTALLQNTLKFPELKTKMEVEFTAVEYPDKGWRALRIKVLEPDSNEDEF